MDYEDEKIKNRLLSNLSDADFFNNASISWFVNALIENKRLHLNEIHKESIEAMVFRANDWDDFCNEINREFNFEPKAIDYDLDDPNAGKEKSLSVEELVLPYINTADEIEIFERHERYEKATNIISNLKSKKSRWLKISLERNGFYGKPEVDLTIEWKLSDGVDSNDLRLRPFTLHNKYESFDEYLSCFIRNFRDEFLLRFKSDKQDVAERLLYKNLFIGNYFLWPTNSSNEFEEGPVFFFDTEIETRYEYEDYMGFYDLHNPNDDVGFFGGYSDLPLTEDELDSGLGAYLGDDQNDKE